MASVFKPQWVLPEGVEACITTCEQGGSSAPYQSFNLALHVGDNADSVRRNRQLLLESCDGLSAIQWLDQVHGTECVKAQALKASIEADACFTQEQGLGCAVMTADCLPVLFCNSNGSQVAAAHAGWRGLAAGVLEETLATFNDAPAQISAYLGPAIGPDHFEVGFEVLEQFFESARNSEQIEAVSSAFKPSPKPMHFRADLYALARAELSALGVRSIHGGDFCTFRDQERFYSYRRQRITGRMACLIWRK